MVASSSMLIQGTGQPVLLLHSSLSSTSQWLPLTRMSGDYQWMAIDLLGYGQNAPVTIDTAFSLEHEVAWINKHLHEIRDVTLVGHSYGAAVALAWAVQYPERVKQLVLYEPVLFGLLEEGDPGLQEIKSLTQALSQIGEKDDGWEQRTALFVNYWGGEGTFQRLSDSLQQALSRVMPKVLLDFAALTQLAFGPNDITHWDFTVHLIMGKHSRLSAHRVVSVLSRCLAKGQVHVLECAGHMGPLTHKEVVNSLILSLIGR